MIARAIGLLLVTAVGGYCLRVCLALGMADPVIEGAVNMKLATALSGVAQALTTCFILVTVRGNQHAGPILGLLAGSIMAQVLGFAGFFAGRDLTAHTVAPGVPSVGTLLSFGLLAAIDYLYCTRPRDWARLSFWPALAALALGSAAVAGYAINIPWLYWGGDWCTDMALSTGLAVSAIAAAHLLRIHVR